MTKHETQQTVEHILGRNLTAKEVKIYSFYWRKVFMNAYDLAAKIAAKD